MRKAHIEEEVLEDRLEERQDANDLEVALLGQERLASCNREGGHDEDPCEREAHACKHDDRGGIGGGDAEEGIAYLHAGKGRSPEEAGNEAGCKHACPGTEYLLRLGAHGRLLGCLCHRVSAAFWKIVPSAEWKV